MSGTRLFFILSLLVSVTPAEFSGVLGHEPVNATVGEDVVLPCRLNPPTDVSTLTVEWTRNDRTVHVYRGRADVTELDEHFRNRTFLFHEEMSRGNISLKLTNVTEKDSGLYFCYVPKLKSQVKRGNVLLTVHPQKNPGGGGGDNETEDDQEQTAVNWTGVIVAIVVSIIAVSAVITLYYIRCRKRGNNL